jgi:hypothetical protein
MKRWSLALLALFVLVASTKYWPGATPHKQADELTPAPQKQWHVWEHNKDDHLLERRAPTEREAERLAISQPNEDSVERAPASVPSVIPRWKERAVMGGKLTEKQPVRLLNEYNPDWEANLAEDLMRFQASASTMLIKHEEQVALVSPHGVTLAEQVIVSTLRSNGEVLSFKALVDSETGELMQTWNRTISHNFRSRPQSFRPEEF